MQMPYQTSCWIARLPVLTLDRQVELYQGLVRVIAMPESAPLVLFDGASDGNFVSPSFLFFWAIPQPIKTCAEVSVSDFLDVGLVFHLRQTHPHT
jgi:hypothetical protein